MLSYRHSFHAGNHADVLKHIVLSLIIDSLKKKEKPFLYLDTHSGAGRYQLSHHHAQKTNEYREGVDPIWQQRDNAPALLKPYLSVLKHYNDTDDIQYYPGSPLIAKQLLRQNDELQLAELHPSDYPLLKKEFANDARASVLQTDGYQLLKSKLPPSSRRGVILIDPSYEMKNDYERVIDGIKEGYKRFATGVYALWYPVVQRQHIKKLIRALKESHIPNILQIELGVKPDNAQLGMTASGMIVINPPWQLATQMRTLFTWLYPLLVPTKTGHTLIEQLVPEKITMNND